MKDPFNMSVLTDPGIAFALLGILGFTSAVLWLTTMTRKLLQSSKTKSGQCSTNQRKNGSYNYRKKNQRKAGGPHVVAANNFSPPHLPYYTPVPILPTPLDVYPAVHEMPSTPMDFNSEQCTQIIETTTPETSTSEETDWIRESKNAPRNAPSDTEDSLASTSSSGKMSRRQRKNKKRRKKGPTPQQNNPAPAPANIEYNSSTDWQFCTLEFFDRLNMSEQSLHAELLNFCVSVEERIISGFPYVTDVGTYIFKAHGAPPFNKILKGRLIEDELQDANPKNFNFIEEIGSPVYIGDYNSTNKKIKNKEKGANENQYDIPTEEKSKSQSFRTCGRCRAAFCISSNGGKNPPCRYHPLKAAVNRDTGLSYYPCCNNSFPCTPCDYHVFYPYNGGLNGGFDDFVSTKSNSRFSQSRAKIFALDCEMIYTSLGLELARFTLISVDGKVVRDEYVIPNGKIYDFNTLFSGIKDGDLRNAMSFQQAQETIVNLVSREDILIGHSLESDLTALKIVHRRVLDTSILFKIETSDPKPRDSRGNTPVILRQALKTLVKTYLGCSIQEEYGHSSVEDAASALNLVLWHTLERRKISRSQKVAPLPLPLQALL